MNKGLLDDKAKKDLEKELYELSLLDDYMISNAKEHEEYNAIKRRDEFVLLDGGIKLPEILMLQNKDGVTEIVKRYYDLVEMSRIDEISKKTGLEKDDLVSLMKDGMELEQIEEIADNLPFKDIAESAAIREMIKRELTPEQLAELRKNEIIELDGNLQISHLEKIAEVDEKGLMRIDDKWFEKNLRPFAEMGMIDISEEMVVKDLEKQEIDGKDKRSLMVVPLERKKEEMTKEEIEKEEIAETIGEDPDNIIRIVRIEDKDAGSKLFDQDIRDTSKPILVQLRNYRFNLLEEQEDGTKRLLQGYEVSHVGKQVSDLLRPTMNTIEMDLKEGDVWAGKTNPTQERYDIFQIRRAGENRYDDPNQLLYVGLYGGTELNVIERKETGDMLFERTPTLSTYPRSIYIENPNRMNEKVNVEDKETYNIQEEQEQNVGITYQDIDRRRALLERLMEIEEEIVQIDTNKGIGTSMDTPRDKVESTNEETKDISDYLADDSRKLPDLYSQRSKILMELGMDESQLVRLDEEIEHVHGPRML